MSDPVLVGVMGMAGAVVSALIANCDKITGLPLFKKDKFWATILLVSPFPCEDG
jgi:hypothetical protein